MVFSEKSFFGFLAERIRTGLAGLGAEERACHAARVAAFEKEPGAYAGRLGGGDIYYTGFAARVLHALDLLHEEKARNLAAFLKQHEPSDIIEALSITNALMLAGEEAIDTGPLFGFLETFRAPDGGYAKHAGAEEGSTYHSFLAGLCYDLCGETAPEQEALRTFTASRRRPDGGFCDRGDASESNTNATAAGVMLVLQHDSKNAALVETVPAYLDSMRGPDGGWSANAHIPFPDLLSTSTALIALSAINAADPVLVQGALDFARQCEDPGGGFKAGPWDNQTDIEYTFYGLSVYALAGEARK